MEFFCIPLGCRPKTARVPNGRLEAEEFDKVEVRVAEGPLEGTRVELKPELCA